jgi:hypothetical protein
MRFAVQLPQYVFIALLVSSKIVVEWDMHTIAPHSAHDATAWPLQTEHLSIRSPPISLRRTGNAQA